MILAWALVLAAGNGQLPMVEYVSDLPDRLIEIRQGWGELGFDVCAHSAGQTPLPLAIGAKTYRKGLGNHAPGRLVVDLNRRYSEFDAEVGINRQPSPEGSVVFAAYVDGVKRFDSGVMTQASPAKVVHLALAGADTLTLVAEPATGDITCDCADWADARLTVAPGAKPELRQPFDIAPSGEVTTWNPRRMDGTRATRTEEFPAADVVLDQPLRALVGGGYRVPSDGCIGLLWLERRRPTELGLQFTGPAPAATGVRVEAWTGPYPFQGAWKPLVGDFRYHDDRLTFSLDSKANPDFAEGFRKVRWVLPQRRALRVARLTATVFARIKTARIRLEADRAKLRRPVTIVPSGCDLAGRHAWNPVRTGTLIVRYPSGAGLSEGPAQPSFRLESSELGVTVRLADILAGHGVYLADQGVFLSAPHHSLRSYRASIRSRRTILERVRTMPDQSFEEAMAKTYRADHFGGPTLLALGADDWKWLVDPNGTVVWEPGPEVADHQMPFENRRCMAAIRFDGKPLHPTATPVRPPGMARWMPVVSLEAADERGACRFTAFVAPVAGHGVFVGRLEVTGSATVDLAFVADRNRGAAATAEPAAEGRFDVHDGARLMAIVDGSGIGAPAAGSPADFRLDGHGPRSATFMLPGWDTKTASGPNGRSAIPDEPALATAFQRTWRAFALRGMQIQIPDRLLGDIIETSRIRCLIDARSTDGGARLAPWIAEIHYGPLESEANTLIRGMALMGQRDFSERALDYFIHLYNPAGYLTTGYALVGTGWHLWTLGEAFQLTNDKAWLSRHASEIARVCRWVVAQRHKTMRLDALGRKPPQFGLVPPGVIADWNAYQYYFYSNGTFCAGLDAAGRALVAVGYPGAADFVREAQAYRLDILRAYRWAQARTPAVPLDDGTWVPGQPSQIHCPGPLSEYYPGDDGSRSWCYDVEVGAHNLIQQGVLPPDGRDSKEMADYLEDVMFLRDGWGGYPAAQSRADWFDLGGFAKVQPYYARLAEVYAMRDDVKPFIRSYFNAIAAMVDPGNLTLWEHFDHMGAPDKTHETGVFLQQTRFMFVKERGRELWLAPFVTNHWMHDGMTVAVAHAPTFFGEVGYRIASHVAHGTIDAFVVPPTLRPPTAIVLRLRHPEGKPMREVLVNGKRWFRFNPVRETVTLPASAGTLRVQARY